MKRILQFVTLALILGIANVGLASGVNQAESQPLPWNSSIFPKKSEGLFPGLEPEYHTYMEVVTELLQVQSNHRAIAGIFSLGASYEGRDIPGIKISDNVQTEESEPEVFICSLHHAREAATVEVAMYIINFLTDNYGRDPYATYLVDSREIYIVPIINPDGKVYDDSGGNYGSGLYWRKNRQPCTEGIGTDLNRNYSYQWGGRRSSGCCASTESFRGYQPFDSPETAAVRDFVTSHPDITVFVDYHSFGGMVLWPWSYTTDPLSNLDDRQVHEIIGKEYARITGYTPMATAELYPCSGTSLDWAYGTTQDDDIPIFSWGIEVIMGNSPNTGFYPHSSALTTTCENNLKACLYVIECADNPYKVLRQWKVSDPVKGGGSPVDSGGNFWYESNYDDTHWKTVYVPHHSGNETSSQFYRHYMTIYHDTQQVLINVGTLSGSITLYVNGQCITHFENSDGEYTVSAMGEVANFDITEFVDPGENVIAVRVDNASEPFDMNITQSTEMYDDKTWKASFITDSGDLLDTKGNIWYARQFDDAAWGICTFPDSDARKWASADRLYRRVFTVPLYTQVFVDFTGCDRIAVYVNGDYVPQADTPSENWPNTSSHDTYHNLLDIAEFVDSGENVIAVCVSGGTPEFDMTLIRLKTLPDLRVTSQDIHFSNPSPSPGDTITIRATNYNSSPVNTPPTTLRFYDGDPGKKALIGKISIGVPASSFHTVEIQWVYPGDVHTIYVVLDEDNTIPEYKETNNTAYAILPVPDSDSWPMFRHDSNHTGVSQLSGLITAPVEKWRVPTGGPVKSSPSVEDINNDGKKEVVFGSDDHYVYAVTADGLILWKVKTGDRVQSSPAISDINNDGKTEVVFGSQDQCVYCVKGEDGKVLWKFVTGGPVNSSPLVYDIDNDGRPEVVFGSHDGCLYAVKGEDGTLLWTFSTGGKISASPVVANMTGKGDFVMIGSTNTFYYLYASTGKIWGEITGCGQFESSPAVGDIDSNGDLDVVIGNQDGFLYAEGGDLFWDHAVGSVQSSPAVADIDHNGDREVITGSDTGLLYALNGEDGSVLWSYQTGGPLYSSAAIGDIDGDHHYEVVVGSTDGCVYALKGVNGTVLWTFRTGAGVESSPAIADIDNDGHAEILTGSNDGNMYVLDSEGFSSNFALKIFLLGMLFLGLLLLGGFFLKKR